MGCITGSGATPATPDSPTTRGIPTTGEALLPGVLACHAKAVHLLHRTHRDAGMVLARSLSSNEDAAEAIFREAFTETVHALNAETAPQFFAAELFTAIRGAAATLRGPAKEGPMPEPPEQGSNTRMSRP
ncbi:hypothetical protein ACFUOZ_20720 [Paenarthrobacter sp. NPDC057355]|uniref:hypothetical protein n=1 Tax=Paenarthrobacter sp. NPDC057355 TaxID=3346105 RepID=UPI003624DBDD